MVLDAARRRSEPLLQRLLTITSANASNTATATDGNTAVTASAKARLGYEEERHKQIRLKNETRLLKGNEKILLTWREIATGTLLLCAFGACTTVFVLLHRQDRTIEATPSLLECEARNALQHKLMEFMAGDNTTASVLSLLADGVSVVAASGLDTSDEGESCAYNVQVCPSQYAGSSPEDEAIMYMLLVGALLTVVGVTVLLYDDNEEAMLKMMSPATHTGDSSLPLGRESMRRASMSSSERIWASEHRNRMGNADLFPDCSVLFADIVGTSFCCLGACCILLCVAFYFANYKFSCIIPYTMIGFEAWSSQREPSQCLNLLETIYDGLDRISRSQGIFKAESGADCYTGKSNQIYL